MTSLDKVAPAFVETAHRIVWCSAATVDGASRPRSRVLHPMWNWDGERLSGVIATGPTPVKVANLDTSPFISCNYWDASHDVATAECRASWSFDDERCVEIWEAFKVAPEPLGYDPAIIPPWADGPTGEAFAVLELEPWRLRVMPGSMMAGGDGELLEWRSTDAV